MAEELNKKESKQKFLEQEIHDLRKKIAIEHQNLTKAKNKAEGIRKKETITLESKRELMTPKVNKI